MPPPNTTAATAIALTNPTDLTVDPENNGGVSYTLWYSLAGIDDSVFSAFSWTDYATSTYRPAINVYKGPNSSTLTQIRFSTGFPNTEKRVTQWETSASESYWIEVVDKGSYGGLLTLRTRQAPDDPIPGDSIYIPADGSTEPSVFIDTLNATYLRVFPDLSNERGVAMPSGEIMTGNNETAVGGLDKQVEIYDAQFVHVASVNPVGTGKTGVGGLQYPIISHNNSTFWTIDYSTGPLRITSWEIALDGTILNAFPFVSPIDDPVTSAAITRDGTNIVYWVSTFGFIYRYDPAGGTVNYTGVSVGGAGPSKSMQVLADGTVVAARGTSVRRYAVSGSLLTLINTYVAPASVYQFHVASDDPDHIWLWSFPDILGIYSQFDKLNIGTGVIDASFQMETWDANYSPSGDDLVPANPSTRQMFGHTSSCPFIVTQASILPPHGCPLELSPGADSGGGVACSDDLSPGAGT